MAKVAKRGGGEGMYSQLDVHGTLTYNSFCNTLNTVISVIRSGTIIVSDIFHAYFIASCLTYCMLIIVLPNFTSMPHLKY